MAKTRKTLSPKRGDVYLVNFDPALGSEIKKTRPAVILQNDVANQYSPVSIVAAISSKFDGRLYPTEVGIHPPEGGLSNPSVVQLNQIRTIDTRRLTERLGQLKPTTIEKVNQALQISLGLLDA